MSSTVAPYRWSVSEFLPSWEAQAFDHRVDYTGAEVLVDDVLGPEPHS